MIIYEFADIHLLGRVTNEDTDFPVGSHPPIHAALLVLTFHILL